MFGPRMLLPSASHTSRALSRALLRTLPIQHGCYRRFSSPATDTPGSLPLEGYRVLDMTRVLAGVSSEMFNASYEYPY